MFNVNQANLDIINLWFSLKKLTYLILHVYTTLVANVLNCFVTKFLNL